MRFYAQHIISNDYNKTTHHSLYFFNHVFGMQVGGEALVDLELAESILDYTLDISRCVRVYISSPARFTICHDNTKDTLVFLKRIYLAVKHLLYVRVVTTIFNNVLPKEWDFLVIVTKVWVVWLQEVSFFKLSLIQCERFKWLTFNPYSVHSILSIKELDNLASWGTQSTVISCHDCLHCLHETTLNVPSLCRLTSGINKTFSTTHCVKEKLLRRESTKVRVLNKATGFWTQVIFIEMGQSPSFKSVRNSISFYVLLSNAGNDLRNVDERSLRSCSNHCLDTISFIQTWLGRFTSVITGSV